MSEQPKPLWWVRTPDGRLLPSTNSVPPHGLVSLGLGVPPPPGTRWGRYENGLEVVLGEVSRMAAKEIEKRQEILKQATALSEQDAGASLTLIPAHELEVVTPAMVASAEGVGRAYGGILFKTNGDFFAEVWRVMLRAKLGGAG